MAEGKDSRPLAFFRGDKPRTSVDDSSSRIKTGGWRACSFILAVELFERFAHHGIASNLVTYLTTVMQESTSIAAKSINNFSGFNAIVPIAGGFIADAYWGKYKTSVVGGAFYVLGIACLTLAVSVPGLRPSSCANQNHQNAACQAATTLQLAFFYCALYMTSIGLGGTSPCLETLGADQFDENVTTGRKRKSSFFNWWYFAISIGSLFASTGLVYIEDNVSWGLGFGIPCAAMAVAFVSFLAGTPFYVRKGAGGSPLTRVAQVLVASSRKWDAQVPSDASLLFEVSKEEHLQQGRRRLLHTPQYKCLDTAAVYDLPASPHKTSSGMTDSRDDYVLLLDHDDPKLGYGPKSLNSNIRTLDQASVNSWQLCTVTQVEEVKLVLRIVPVILATLIYGLAHAQATTLFVRQGSTLDRTIAGNFKIAAASLQLFSFITCLVALPVYDRFFVPLAQKFTGNERGISLLQRIGVGMFLTMLCMVIAAATEMVRLNVAKDNDLLDDPSVALPMSIFWLMPQYILIGLSNVFTVVGKQEFFYDQVPDTMRSLGMAVYLLTSGAGAYLSSFLISLVDLITTINGGESWFVNNLNRCHIDYFYWLLAGLNAANLCVYVVVARNFTYKRAENAMLSMQSLDSTAES